MAHCFVEAAEQILDKEFPVLDKGFVRLVDYLGSDERVVQAARVSYGAGTKTYREDAALIDYLLRNEHTSPFEQVVLTFHIKLPIFVARQMVRHRTARLNEISGRYSVMKDDFYVPALEDIALQSTDNKQGRMAEPVDPDTGRFIQEQLEAGQRQAYQQYQNLLEQGLARELARINLPLSLYTEWYWQMDLHNLFHFLKLRLDPHAQKEIRAYAQVMFDIARTVAPRCCESFERHILGGVRFSREEFVELQRRLGITPQGKPETKHSALQNAKSPEANGASTAETGRLTGKNLERFEEKLRTGRQT
ncbi:MAG TPA: FAD-dependent thymidylate synthase [Termitinemataceae bacterium]|nr:FAD-dependent thymidylate synthase [Termitinemataceae bacterium]HOM24468.1 FAD-dependent thymidylate synthase [Termitinemataceae bacterium]HPQ01591.1 FAD-dependent thymidylate synthase [Termitinemataceae bacterium]